MKKWICLLCALLVFLCGCGKEPKRKPSVELTRRQLQILEQEGLPGDYQQLLPSQKEAIVAIEEMLRYAEEKYGEEFVYAGYIPSGLMEPEQLMAYPASGSEALHRFTVTTTPEGYADDYIAVRCREPFEGYLSQNFQKFCPSVQGIVYGNITELSLTEVPCEGDAFDGNTAASLMIFLNGDTCTDEEYLEFESSCEQFLRQHRLYGMAQIIRIKGESFQKLTRFNYTDYLSQEHYDRREELSVQP